MVIVEKSFPRGGQVPTPVSVPDKYRFGAKTVKAKKPSKTASKKKQDKAKKRKDPNAKLIAKSATPITRRTVQEGMLLMGVVSKIEKTQLIVALPSKLRGTVQLTAVSESYTRALEKLLASGRTDIKVPQLQDLFTIGQSICCKVLSLTDKSHLLSLSVNPKDTHADLSHSQLNEGMVLTGALASWEDHGAIIDIGIANTRCFLARSPKTAGLDVGQLVQCRIDTLTKTASTANVILSVVTEAKERTVDLETIEQVDRLLPTTTVRLTVLSNTLRNGISGKILDGQFEAFINEQNLGAGKKKSDFNIGQDILATVLYVMPLTKFVYLTLNKFVPEDKRLAEGSVHENVAVLSVQANGVLVKLDKTSLGLISVRGMKTGEKNLDDLQRKYGSVVKQVRIISYDAMDGIYFCTDDAKLVAEKFLRLTDVSVGQVIRCKVREPFKEHGILVKVGQLNGFIYKTHVEKGLAKSKVGATIKARVLYVDEVKNSVHLTTLKEFLRADFEADLQLDQSRLKVGQDFLGMVSNVTPQLVFVEFFNRLTGTMKNEASSRATFRIGAVMRFNVTKVSADRIFVSECKQKAVHKIGEIAQGTVLGMFEAGVELEVPGKKGKSASVWVDKEFSTEFPELVPHMCLSYRKGETVSAIAISNSSYSVRDVAAFQKYPLIQRSNLVPGKLIRAFVERAEPSGLVVQVPLLDGTESAKIPYSAVLMNEAAVEKKQTLFVKNQTVYVKVTAPVTKTTKNLPLSARLDQTYSGNGYATINYLKDYFAQLAKVQRPMFQSNKFTWQIGSKVDGEVLKVIRAGAEYEIQFGGKFKGNLKSTANLSVKEAIKCVIVWVDETGSIFLSNDERVVGLEGEPNAVAFTNKKERGYIVYETKYCYVVLLEGARNYVFVPIRLHYNDFQPVLVGRTGHCQIVILHTNGDRKIALFKEVYDRMLALGMKVQEPSLKRPLDEEKDEQETEETGEATTDDDDTEDVEMVEDDKEQRVVKELEDEPKKKKQKVEEVVQPEKQTKSKKKVLPPKMIGNPVVIGEKSAMANFWTMDFGTVQSNNQADFEMDLDEEEEAATGKKTHKQGPSETDIRNLEEALASSANIPASTAEFERLVLATPNNSLIWIKFMVFHLQALEVDKARHVFRRALKSINFRWQDDILNVWVAYLNLELRYGTQESFDQAFTEALATNDQFKVSVRTIEILADSDKIALCKAKATIAMKKFKERAELWPKVGAAYFRMGLKEEANQLVNKALTVLDKRDHLQVIVEFAKLNRANGQMDVASTLLEQILTSYPKRTDIWSFYVDMLIKENEVESARAVLERATSQKLPAKKMKTLFKKYLEFEERFGDEKAVAHVKQMAAEYVQSQQ